MSEQINQYINYLFSWGNPIFFSIFFVISIIVIFYFFNKYVLLPIHKKHVEEKREIELKNTRQMALFTSLDPDPVIRTAPNGKILFYNEAADKLFKFRESSNIVNYISGITEYKIKSLIEKDGNATIPFSKNNRFYSILITGNENLNLAHLYFRDITLRKNLENKLKELTNYLHNQLEEERNRIAGELHDSIGQDLLLIKLKLQKLDENIIEAENKNDIDHLNNILLNTINELRAIIYELKPKILDEMGLEAAISSLVQKVSDESKIKATLDIKSLNGKIDKKIELFIFRFVQEALNNILKHSMATEFNIFLKGDNDIIRCIISDNGKGFDVENKFSDSSERGLGLINMKERTEGFGGKFIINSNCNEGTIIITEIPFERNKL